MPVWLATPYRSYLLDSSPAEKGERKSRVWEANSVAELDVVTLNRGERLQVHQQDARVPLDREALGAPLQLVAAGAFCSAVKQLPTGEELEASLQLHLVSPRWDRQAQIP